jgi:hypothetical protein
MKETTIGQRLLTAVISHQLGIGMDRAMKLYVRGQRIDPSWEAAGAELLKYSPASGSGPAASACGEDVAPSLSNPQTESQRADGDARSRGGRN